MTRIADEQARNIMSRIKEALNQKFSENSEYPRFRALTDSERRQWAISSVNTLEKQVINDIIVTEIIREINHDMLIASIKTAQMNKQVRKFMQRDYARFKMKQERRLSGGGGGDEVREPYKEPKKLEEPTKLPDVVLDFDHLRNFVDRHLEEFKAFEKQAVEDMFDVLKKEFDIEELAKKCGISTTEMQNQLLDSLKGSAMLSAEEKGQPLIKEMMNQLEKSGALPEEYDVTNILKGQTLMQEIRLASTVNRMINIANAKPGEIHNFDNDSNKINVSKMLKTIKKPEISSVLQNTLAKQKNITQKMTAEANHLTVTDTVQAKVTSTRSKT